MEDLVEGRSKCKQGKFQDEKNDCPSLEGEY